MSYIFYLLIDVTVPSTTLFSIREQSHWWYAPEEGWWFGYGGLRSKLLLVCLNHFGVICI